MLEAGPKMLVSPPISLNLLFIFLMENRFWFVETLQIRFLIISMLNVNDSMMVFMILMNGLNMILE